MVLCLLFFFLRYILVSVDIPISSLRGFSVSYSKLLDLWKLGTLISMYEINLDCADDFAWQVQKKLHILSCQGHLCYFEIRTLKKTDSAGTPWDSFYLGLFEKHWTRKSSGIYYLLVSISFVLVCTQHPCWLKGFGSHVQYQNITSVVFAKVEMPTYMVRQDPAAH